MKKPISFSGDTTLDWLSYIEGMAMLAAIGAFSYRAGGVWPYIGALAIAAWLFIFVMFARSASVTVSVEGLSLHGRWGRLQFIAWTDMIIHEVRPPRRIFGMLVSNPSLEIKFSAQTIPGQTFVLPCLLDGQVEFWRCIMDYAPEDHGVRARVAELPIMLPANQTLHQ